MYYMENKTLRVPGATLSYRVCGRGPLLLLIPGGGNDAHVFDGIAPYLIDQYSVVTYDRRGLSQSQLDTPGEEQLVETHSDDAHRLLKELSNEYEPAYVFGSSGGAIVGLDLVAHHPEQIYTLIAHEPPTHLSPEADPIQEMAAVRDAYLQDGIVAAFHKLMAIPGLSTDGWKIESGQQPAPADRDLLAKNFKFLFEHEFAMYDRYQLAFPALKSATTQARIVLAGGGYHQDTTYQSAVAVADRLGTTIVEFPGRHIGYVTNPQAFAQRLLEVLDEKPTR